MDFSVLILYNWIYILTMCECCGQVLDMRIFDTGEHALVCQRSSVRFICMLILNLNQ